ncbi:hypothetical protein [Candidatus Venteria ishoeyi]|uniref:hypothetical protein n=1 Tax=Candidatus Venteria ishoeyi TaxID=1899563 RepID=UPI0011B07AAF|nr:hypothetical protein [Candidatus Venteria ishoeyi]
MKQVAGNPRYKKLSDTKSLEKVIEHIANDMNENISDNYTIESLISLYISEIPEKTYKFVASYILKGIAITNPDSNNGIYDIYALSSYKTFKNKFTDIHNVIDETYGKKYRELCDIAIAENKVSIDFKISESSKDKSRELVHSLSLSLKEILNGNVCKLEIFQTSKIFMKEKFEGIHILNSLKTWMSVNFPMDVCKFS